MKDENQSRMAVIEQGAEEIRRSNLFSNTFASIALEDRAEGECGGGRRQ